MPAAITRSQEEAALRHGALLTSVLEGAGVDLTVASAARHPFYSRFVGSSLGAGHMNAAFCRAAGMSDVAVLDATQPRPALVPRHIEAGGVDGVATVMERPPHPTHAWRHHVCDGDRGMLRHPWAPAVGPSEADARELGLLESRGRDSPRRSRGAQQQVATSNRGPLPADLKSLRKWSSQVETAFPQPLLAGLSSAAADGTVAASSGTWKLRHAVEVNRAAAPRGTSTTATAVTHSTVQAAAGACAAHLAERYAELMASVQTSDEFRVELAAPADHTSPIQSALGVRCGKRFDASALHATEEDHESFTRLCMMLFVALADGHSVRRGANTEVVLRSVAGAQGSLRPCVTCITGDSGRFWLHTGLVSCDALECFALALRDLNVLWHRDCVPSLKEEGSDDGKVWQRLVSPTPERGHPSRAWAACAASPLIAEAVTTLLLDHVLAHAETAQAHAEKAAEAEAQHQFVVSGVDHGFSVLLFASTWRPEEAFLGSAFDELFRENKQAPLDVDRAIQRIGSGAHLVVIPRAWPLQRLAPAAEAQQRQQRQQGAHARAVFAGGLESPQPAGDDGRSSSRQQNVPRGGSSRGGATSAVASAASFLPEIRALFPLSYLEDDAGLTLAERCEFRAAGIGFRQLERLGKKPAAAALESTPAAVVAATPLSIPGSFAYGLSDGTALPAASMAFASAGSALNFAIAAAKSIVRVHRAASASTDSAVLSRFVPHRGMFPSFPAGGSSTGDDDSVPSSIRHADFTGPSSFDRFVTSFAPFEDAKGVGERQLLVVHHSAVAAPSSTVWQALTGGDRAVNTNKCPAVVIVATGAAAAAIQNLVDALFAGHFFDRTVFLVIDESVDEAAAGSSLLAGPVARIVCLSWKRSVVDGVAAVWQSNPLTHRSPFLSTRGGTAASHVARLSAAAATATTSLMSLLPITPRSQGGALATPDTFLSQLAEVRRAAGAFIAVRPRVLIGEVNRALDALYAGEACSSDDDDDDGDVVTRWERRVVPTLGTHLDKWTHWASLIARVDGVAANAAKTSAVSNGTFVRRGSKLLGAGSPAGSLPAGGSFASIPQLAGGGSTLPMPPSIGLSAVGDAATGTSEAAQTPNHRVMPPKPPNTPPSRPLSTLNGSAAPGTAAGSPTSFTAAAPLGATVAASAAAAIEDTATQRQQSRLWAEAQAALVDILGAGRT